MVPFYSTDENRIMTLRYSLNVKSNVTLITVRFTENQNKVKVDLFAGSGKKENGGSGPLDCSIHQPTGIAVDSKSNTCLIAGHSQIHIIKYH